MKIGTLLNIELRKSGEFYTEKFRSRVIEQNETFLFIDYPIDIKTHKTSFFPKGTSFLITYVDENENIYSFLSKLVAKVKLNVPALAIELPSDLQRIQRREFVRVDTAIDVAVHPLDDRLQPFTTVTRNISGGGISVIIPKDVDLKENNVEIFLSLPLKNHGFAYLKAIAEVVILEEKKHKNPTVAMKFLNIAKQDQQMIIRYCFEKQREARKKELS
ncbi:flagellar brake protein [Virgibacillus salexigens]|uniref:flagellar brake protein n=1 Tax=Virgibacillus salexigens TaxID=61016 RepID=UPI0030814DDE